jgi:hypothetical protein
MENPSLVIFENLNYRQINRVYKVVSSTGKRLYGIRNFIARPIQNKVEFNELGHSKKDRCLKLKVDRLGIITGIKH